MKQVTLWVMLVFTALSSHADFARVDVSVTEVGLSLNSNRVFIVASPSAFDSVCGDKNYYSMKLGEPESYLFY